MPRFFFHFVHDSEWLSDGVGLELSGLRSAHCYSMLLIHQATGRFEDAPDWRGWRIAIADGSGRHLLTVLFPRVLRPGARASPSPGSPTGMEPSDAECRPGIG